MLNLNRHILLHLFLLLPLFLGAQEEYTLHVKSTQPGKFSFARIKYQESFNTPENRKKEINQLLIRAFEKGFLTAQADSLVYDSTHLRVYIDPGDPYILKELRPGNVEDYILRQSGYRKKYFSGNKPFHYPSIATLLRRILRYAENNGHPFASIGLDSIRMASHPDAHGISAALNLTKNERFFIDSLIIKGDARINRNYLYNYLGIKPGDVYNEKRMVRIPQKLNEMPFVQRVKPHEIAFTPGNATVYIFIDNKRASQFDGIIGIVPNDKTTGKVLLTGDVKLKLLNIFRRGERIDFNWQKLEEASQNLSLDFNYPYLFNTPFGVDYRLQLYKKDTSYLNVTNTIGIQYIFYGYNYVKAFFENRRSSLISTYGLAFATTLPEYADVSTSFYGLEGNFESLDYKFNPRRGTVVKLNGAVGEKKIMKNRSVNEALYDSLDLQTTQYKIEIDAGRYFPLAKKFTLLLQTRFGYLSSQNLFENELFRLGGLHSLRGFDEEAIPASMFTIVNTEIRYLFGANSYAVLFWNGALYTKNTMQETIKDKPFGFGAGLNFATQAGIFSVSYALGRQFDNPIDLKNAKIHFGITATF